MRNFLGNNVTLTNTVLIIVIIISNSVHRKKDWLKNPFVRILFSIISIVFIVYILRSIFR